jgi:hypothetical protein
METCRLKIAKDTATKLNPLLDKIGRRKNISAIYRYRSEQEMKRAHPNIGVTLDIFDWLIVRTR